MIPSRKMQKIYREMMLADQWINDNPDQWKKADTTWFYEPIFKKYGYNSDDYRRSVDHYLNDPERYVNMIEKVRLGLKTDADRLYSEIEKEKNLRLKADSIARSLGFFSPKDLSLFYFRGNERCVGRGIEIVKDEKGCYRFESVPGDTLFSGPGFVVKDSTSAFGSVSVDPSAFTTNEPLVFADRESFGARDGQAITKDRILLK